MNDSTTKTAKNKPIYHTTQVLPDGTKLEGLVEAGSADQAILVIAKAIGFSATKISARDALDQTKRGVMFVAPASAVNVASGGHDPLPSSSPPPAETASSEPEEGSSPTASETGLTS